jgi:hypothetical protein
MKFLIDECLSPRLASRAVAAGYAGSSRVVWLDRRGAQDWELKQIIIDEDWSFVTRNSVDFHGPTDRIRASGHYSDMAIQNSLMPSCALATGADKVHSIYLYDQFRAALYPEFCSRSHWRSTPACSE